MDKTFKIEFTWLSDLLHGRDVIKALTDKTYGYALCQGVAAGLLGFIPFILTLFEGRGFVLLLLLTFVFSYPLGGNILRWAKEMSPEPDQFAPTFDPALKPKPENEKFQMTDLSELTGKPKVPRARKKIAE